MKNAVALLAFFILLISIPSAAQENEELTPPPAHVYVPNRLQQTPVWCWAAVSEQIIEWSKGFSPPQCALVAIANNLSPATCCGRPNPACVHTGTMSQVQSLIAIYGGRPSHIIHPSFDPLSLHVHLIQGKPIILQVRTNPSATHVVVIVGISFMKDKNGTMFAWLHANDPMSMYTQPILYNKIYPLIVNALVID